MFFAGLSVTALLPNWLHRNLHYPHSPERRLNCHDVLLPGNVGQYLLQLPSPTVKTDAVHVGSKATGTGVNPLTLSPWETLAKEASVAEQSILEFFHRDKRALEDGLVFGGTERQLEILTKHLANQIASCHTSEDRRMADCTFREVFVGGS